MNDLRLPINEAREVPLSQILDIALLDGELAADDCRDYVMKLITALEKLHHVRDFSHRERYGFSDPLSNKALNEISEALQEAKVIVKQAKQNSSALVIESSVRIKVAIKLSS
ncbi:MAG: hypothetical protein SV765_16655 [Pseudomonadota bacterium]|nr:hypothetical protein [Pseudomonadota bacterium]